VETCLCGREHCPERCGPADQRERDRRDVGAASGELEQVQTALAQVVEQGTARRLRGAPASMTKMMLALLTLEAVRDGQLTLSDPVRVSRSASRHCSASYFHPTIRKYNRGWKQPRRS